MVTNVIIECTLRSFYVNQINNSSLSWVSSVVYSWFSIVKLLPYCWFWIFIAAGRVCRVEKVSRPDKPHPSCRNQSRKWLTGCSVLSECTLATSGYTQLFVGSRVANISVSDHRVWQPEYHDRQCCHPLITPTTAWHLTSHHIRSRLVK